MGWTAATGLRVKVRVKVRVRFRDRIRIRVRVRRRHLRVKVSRLRRHAPIADVEAILLVVYDRVRLVVDRGRVGTAWLGFGVGLGLGLGLGQS